MSHAPIHRPDPARHAGAALTRVVSLLGRAAFALGLGTLATPALAASAPPAWWSYERSAEFGARHTQVKVPMRDGVRLGCDLHRPTAKSGATAPGRYPAIVYEVTPYAVNNSFYLEQGDYFARRGYNAIMCNVRGTGRSGGSYPQMNQPAEQTDAYDLVEWIAAQPYTNGRVGQTGESYGGMSTYRAAASRAPSLRAVAPQQAPNDLYLEDIYPGGIPTRPVLENWWPVLAGATSFGRANPAKLYAVQRAHPTRDAFWQQVAIDGVLDQVQVPVLAFGGWQDRLFRSGSMRNYERLVARGNPNTYLIYGPWSHGEVIDWKGCRLIALACAAHSRVPRGMLLAWFDRWVAGLPNAPVPERPVTSFQSGGAGWRELPGLPQDALAEHSLTLRSDAGLAPEGGPAGERVFRATPLDGLMRQVRSISFTGAPLERATDIAGRPALDLAFTSSATDANLHVELELVRHGGATRTLAEGFLRASHQRSHASPTPLVPAAINRATIELEPLDLRLAAGSRLVVRISGGNAAKLVPIPRALDLAVLTGEGGSALRIRSAPADRAN